MTIATTTGPLQMDDRPRRRMRRIVGGDGGASVVTAESPPRTDVHPRKRLRRIVGWLVVLVAAGVALVSLRHKLPDFTGFLDAVRAANPWWLVAAAAAEIVSMRMFARQQRRLLRAFGVSMTLRRAVAITYARSAISATAPAGAAVSAAFALHQFRRVRADAAVAATVMILSGVASMCGLVLLYGIAAGATALQNLDLVVVLAAAALITVTAGLLAHHRTHHPHPRKPRTPAYEGGRIRTALAPALDALRAARTVPARHWLAVIAAAATNWFADLICLIAVAHAFAFPGHDWEIAAVYLATQVVRQIPLTPGGIGLIETSLLTGLLAIGADPATAAATVLGYRVLSFWLVLPAGLVAGVGLRRAPR
ncbi:lysylphosphatidylglycerol synthase transmembrane domain-containing protein [Actinokineospora enzanensis]|uniref:lysylphosphatidylglycerol synthase transmembrane domain-containing protein n=1 Tax=Actinokineospora enzanensis TaxID=155975 RepID=UPI000380DA1A|nr:YbhN family protein [Actinokineospora enzanensis]